MTVDVAQYLSNMNKVLGLFPSFSKPKLNTTEGGNILKYKTKTTKSTPKTLSRGSAGATLKFSGRGAGAAARGLEVWRGVCERSQVQLGSHAGMCGCALRPRRRAEPGLPSRRSGRGSGTALRSGRGAGPASGAARSGRSQTAGGSRAMGRLVALSLLGIGLALLGERFLALR